MNGPEKRQYRSLLLFHKLASFLGSGVHSRGAGTPDAAGKIAFHLEQADALLRVGEYDKAAAHYQDAIKLAPGDKALQDELQKCHAMREQFQLAIESFWKDTLEDTVPTAEKSERQPHPVAAQGAGRNRARYVIFTLPAAIVVILVLVVPQLTDRGKVALQPRGKDLRNDPAKPLAAASNRKVAVAPDPPPASPGKNPSNAGAIIEVKKHKKYDRNYQSTGYAHVHPADTVKFE